MLADKLHRAELAGLPPPENTAYVPADVTAEDWPDARLSAGFDPARKTLFARLGLWYYLTEEEISALLKSIGRIASRGSGLQAFEHVQYAHGVFLP